MDNVPEKPVEPAKVHVPQVRLVKAVEEFSGHPPFTVTVEGTNADQREDLASLIAAFLSNKFKKNRVYLRMAGRPSWTVSEEGEQDLIAHLTSEDNCGGLGTGGEYVPRDYSNILVRDGTSDHPTWTMDPPNYKIPKDGMMYLGLDRKVTGPLPFLFPSDSFSYSGKKLAVSAIVLHVAESSGDIVVRLDKPVIFKPKNAVIEAEEQIRKVIRSKEQLEADIIPIFAGVSATPARLPSLTLFGHPDSPSEEVEVAVHLSLAIDCVHHTIDYAITNLPLLRGKRSKVTPLGLVLDLVDEP